MADVHIQERRHRTSVISKVLRQYEKMLVGLCCFNWTQWGRGVIKDRWQLPSTCLLCKTPHLLCSEQMNSFKQKRHEGCKGNHQGPAKIDQKPRPWSSDLQLNHRKEADIKLTVGALFLGGSGKGRLGASAAPIAEVSLSNMALMVVLWTRVTCGGSLACMHVRMYYKEKKNQLSHVHI